MLKKRKIENLPPAAPSHKRQSVKNFLNIIVFGTLMGVPLAVALASFVPKYFPEWAGSLVCPGRVQYVMFRQIYLCYTSNYDFFELGDAMYWAILKRAIFVTVPLGMLLVFGLMRLGIFFYRRREAAGF